MDIIKVKEKELFESLVNGIKEIYPVKKPRASYNINIGVNRVKLEIEFYFYEDRTGKVSRYVYLKKNGKKVNAFLLDGKVNLSTINEIYKFIFRDYSNIRKFAFQDGELHIGACLSYKNIYLEGISCTDIILKFRGNSNLSINLSNEIFAWYEYFINNFIYLLKTFRKEQTKMEYNCLKKKNIVDNMSKDEMEEFYDFIDDDTLKYILKNMDIVKFSELLYNVFKMKFSSFDNEFRNKFIDGMSINDVKEMLNYLDENTKRDMLKTIKGDIFLELHTYFKSKKTKEERDNLKKALSTKNTKKTGNEGK